MTGTQRSINRNLREQQVKDLDGGKFRRAGQLASERRQARSVSGCLEPVSEARIVFPPGAVGHGLDFVGQGVHRASPGSRPVTVPPSRPPPQAPTRPAVSRAASLAACLVAAAAASRASTSASTAAASALSSRIAWMNWAARNGTPTKSPRIHRTPPPSTWSVANVGPVWAAQALVVMQRDEVLVGDDRDAEERVPDDLSGGNPHGDRAVVVLRHRVNPQERPEVQIPGRDEREVGQFPDRAARGRPPCTRW